MSVESTLDGATDEATVRWYGHLVRRYVGVGPYLDFGCGSGRLLRLLSEHGSASGVETAPGPAEHARRAAPGCPVHAVPIGIPRGVFRAITAIDVLPPLDAADSDAARDEMLACWRRVLLPGGRVLVVVPRVADPEQHARWRQILLDAGFVVLREGSDGLRAPGTDPRRAGLPAVVRSLPHRVQLRSGYLFLRPGPSRASVFVLELPPAGPNGRGPRAA